MALVCSSGQVPVHGRVAVSGVRARFLGNEAKKEAVCGGSLPTAWMELASHLGIGERGVLDGVHPRREDCIQARASQEAAIENGG